MTGNCFESIECRWFHRGLIPTNVITWFTQELGDLLIPIDRRNDVYLKSSASEIGVKFRQGRLEVKYRSHPIHRCHIHGYQGHIERWTKWICHQPQSSPWADITQESWITVEKERYQRLYKYLEGDPLSLTSLQKPEDGAIALEVTQLYLNQQPWWTIAVEYLGGTLDLENTLSPILQFLLMNYQGTPLTLENSASYPQWLSRV